MRTSRDHSSSLKINNLLNTSFQRFEYVQLTKIMAAGIILRNW